LERGKIGITLKTHRFRRRLEGGKVPPFRGRDLGRGSGVYLSLMLVSLRNYGECMLFNRMFELK
jgi:hypothetical protein